MFLHEGWLDLFFSILQVVNPSHKEVSPCRGYSGWFKRRRCAKDFFGFEIFDSRIFLGENIFGQVFFGGGVSEVGICLGIQNNMKSCEELLLLILQSACVVLRMQYNQTSISFNPFCVLKGPSQPVCFAR